MLAADPLAQLPFRHSYSAGVGAIHLCRTGPVTLALLVVEPQAAVRPTTIAFTDCERREIVLAGRGRGLAFRFADSGPPEAEPFALARGVQMGCDADRSRAFVSLDEPLVLLRLARDPLQAMPTREVEIATGRIVHRASASPAEGRAELAATLLGAMERADAAPTLAAYACGKTGGCGQANAGPRWQALRNALALDTEAGFAALCALADRPGDPLAPQAEALREQLRTSYPQLVNKVSTPCLAN